MDGTASGHEECTGLWRGDAVAMRVYLRSGGRSSVSVGWIGMIVVLTGYMMVAMFWLMVGAAILTAALFFAILGGLGLAFEGALSKSSRWQARRRVRGPLVWHNDSLKTAGKIMGSLDSLIKQGNERSAARHR